MSVHDLQAPKEDGGLLAYPPKEKTGQLLEDNCRALDALHFEILGKPYQALRSLARASVLDAAQKYLTAAGEHLPAFHGTHILLAGHQPELFHPGVWLKNFALRGLARAHGAISLNLVVDNDTAKNTLLHVPAGERLAQIPYDHWQSEVPFEERAVLDEGLFRNLPRAAAPLMSGWNFTPLLHDFWAEVCRQGERTPLLGERFAAARRACERRWGCDNLELPLSLVCQTEAFAWFAAHLIENLPRFHQVYNEIVDAYRQRHGVRSRHHPVPDLSREGDWLEAPLWAWRAGQKRRGRLFTRRSSAGFEMRAGVESWPIIHLGRSPEDMISQWQSMAAAGFKIRTRALTTTLYARLFLGDLFLHGLGGGKYDELTDEIMRRFYHIEPPAFLVLTGTLLLPFPRLPVSQDEGRRLHSLNRDLWWNPQRHLADGGTRAGKLAEDKRRWMDRAPASPAAKRERFETLRKFTGELRPFVRDQVEQTRHGLEQATRTLRFQQVHTRRDYAFCLYPEEVLRPFLSQVL